MVAILDSSRLLTVQGGDDLTVRPGTTVDVTVHATDYELKVDGKLTAEGTSTDSIYFRSTNNGTNPSEWYGIVFSSGSSDASSLKYCAIKNAFYAVYVNGVDPSITNNTISYSYQGVRTLGMGSAGEINDNKLHDNTTGLIMFTNSTPEVDGNTIYDSGSGGGVYMHSSSPDFKNNTVRDNSGVGVRLYYDSDPEFGEDEITGSNGHGLYLSNGSDPDLYTPSGGGRHNNIHENGGDEIRCYYDSEPELGVPSFYGDNDIVNVGDDYAIYLVGTTHGNIYAYGNYWGTSSPDPEDLFYPDGDDIYYVPYDDSTNFKPVVLPGPSVTELVRLHEGRSAERNGKYAEALEIYDELLQSAEGERVLERAGDGLLRTALALGAGLENAISMFANMAVQHSAPGVKREAARLWRQALVASKQYDAARRAYEEVMTTGGTFEDRLAAQVALGGLYTFFLNDEAKAREMLEPILEDYADHPQAYAAWQVMLDIQDLPPPSVATGEPEGQPVTAPDGSPEVTLETAPNPANPSVIVRFWLPQAMQVELGIYDVLGRKVRTLVSGEVRLSGHHQVSWNGQDEDSRTVASGVYVVDLQANQETYVQKVTMIR